MLEMLDHPIGVFVTTMVEQTSQAPTMSQTVILAVEVSGVRHGIAVQLQFSPHTAGSLACEMITFGALNEVDL